MLKTQFCVTRPQCVKLGNCCSIHKISRNSPQECSRTSGVTLHYESGQDAVGWLYAGCECDQVYLVE